MTTDKTYNGWTNYETWAVKLWIDNEQGSYSYWKSETRDVWEAAEDKYPNQFMDRNRNAQSLLAERLQAAHDTESDHPVFNVADGTVYADLLNAALSEVNWHEIADALLSDMAEDTDKDEPKYVSA